MPARFIVGARAASSWSTRVVVAPGALARVGAELRRVFPDRRVVVIADARVARLHAGPLVGRLTEGAPPPLLLTFPPGERSKTRETKARLEDRLLAAGVGRDAVVVALGGGVSGDLAGFVAATWHRGVPFVAIPTTLLAMVDAALGGKTGVDVPGGKNLVGAFHQPRLLWADVHVLRTLPDRVYRAGLAEVVKTAVALDAALFRRVERDKEALAARDLRTVDAVVARCLRLKGRVVADDERESGPRAALNVGHTAAHAIEAASGFTIPHGEAVAIGLVAEARLAVRVTGFPPGQVARIEALLAGFGLPVRVPGRLDRRRLIAAAQRDKKTRGGVVRAALPARIGRVPSGDDPTVAIDAARDLAPLLAPN
jgi:3-dehydroquinate synthase